MNAMSAARKTSLDWDRLVLYYLGGAAILVLTVVLVLSQAGVRHDPVTRFTVARQSQQIVPPPRLVELWPTKRTRNS